MSGEAGPSLKRSSTATTSSSTDKPLPRLSTQAVSVSASASSSSSSNPLVSGPNGTSPTRSNTNPKRISNLIAQQLNQSQSARYPSSWNNQQQHPDLKRVSAASAGSSSAHSRRPSRAERYEQVVDAARNVLRRGERDVNNVSPQEWLDACYSLLKIIDGMSKQLATHDELAAQLKIAQSNLTLAETHSEFLEETLRRRGSTDQNSITSSLALAATHSNTGVGSAVSSSKQQQSHQRGGYFSDTLKGLGLDHAGDFEPPKPSFFSRLPSARRKNASSLQSTASSDVPPAVARRMSQAELPKDIEGLTAEVFELRSLVHNLEAACKNWQSGTETLSKANEEHVRQIVHLEKTNNDLMAELENLSMELFQEANTMVAEERKARAKAEQDAQSLRSELSSMSIEIDRLRRELDDGGLEGVRRAEEELERALGVSSPRISSVPLRAQSSDNTVDGAATDDADKSSASKRWYNFGRSGSGSSKQRRTPSPLPDSQSQQPVSPESISNPVLVSSSMPLFNSSSDQTPRPSVVGSSGGPPVLPSVGQSTSPAMSSTSAFQPLLSAAASRASSLKQSTSPRIPAGAGAGAGTQSPASFSGRSDASTTGVFHTPPLPYSPTLSLGPHTHASSAISPPMPGSSTWMTAGASSDSGAQQQQPPSRNSSINRRQQPLSRPTALDLQATVKRTPQDIIAEEQRKIRSPISPNEARWKEKAGTLASTVTTPVSPFSPANAPQQQQQQVTAPSDIRQQAASSSGTSNNGLSLVQSRPSAVQRSRSYDERPNDRAQPSTLSKTVERSSTTHHNPVPARRPGTAEPSSYHDRNNPYNLQVRTTDVTHPRTAGAGGAVSAGPSLQSLPATATRSRSPAGLLLSPAATQTQFSLPNSTSVSSNLSAASGTGSTRGARVKAGEDLDKLMRSIEDMNQDLFGQ